MRITIGKWRWALRWQLMATYLPLILLPVLVVSIVGRSVAEQGLTLLVTQNAQQRAQRLAQGFADYYDKNGSWTGISDAMQVAPPIPGWLALTLGVRSALESSDTSNKIMSVVQFLQSNGEPPPQSPGDGPGPTYLQIRFNRLFTPEQVLIVDQGGVVVATDGDRGLGERLTSEVISQGIPIIVKGQAVGTLVIGAALGILDEQQRGLLDAVNAALLASAGLSGLLTIILGLLLSWQITHPARQLMIGVQRLARGEWREPLIVASHNEFGDLTRAFNSMATEITRQEQLRRQMVADVAHDLRTPLSAMQLEVEALEAGLQTPEAAAISLREEIVWLQRLVEDLRLLSLMDADQVHLVVVPTPLFEFLDGIRDFWQPMADERERILTLEAAADLPPLMIDPGRLRQVISNLLDNALRHTRPGGHIVIRAWTELNARTGQVLIQVRDDGEGIAPEDMSRVFDRFYRADRARTFDRNAEGFAHGSGLGLSIAQRLIELHGGTISVESTPGQGATFTISLPLSVSAAPAPAAPRPVGIRPVFAQPS